MTFRTCQGSNYGICRGRVAKIFPPRPKIFRQAKAANCPARTANQSPTKIPAEAGLHKKYKLEPRRLPKLDLKPKRKEDDLEYKQQLLEAYIYEWTAVIRRHGILGESLALREIERIFLLSSCEKTFVLCDSFSAEGYCIQARQTVTGLRDKPVTQQDALPNSEVPAKIYQPGCFDVLTKQDDKGDASNRDNGSCLDRNLGGDSDLGRASCCVIGLSLSPIN
ncbi:hypothetical protein GQ457_02G024410 [Hibiscus cannabinus]